MIQARERCKTTIIRVIHEARDVHDQLGRRMATAGWFEDANDFGSLTDAELDAFLEDPSVWQPTLRSRRPLFDQLRHFVSLLCSRAARHRPIDGLAVTKAVSHPGGGHNTVGPARSPARPLVTLESYWTCSIPPDFYQVTCLSLRVLTASWTPLFVPACAVVVDVGATMSHAVIVSRGSPGSHASSPPPMPRRRSPMASLVRVDGLRGTGHDLVVVLTSKVASRVRSGR